MNPQALKFDEIWGSSTWKQRRELAASLSSCFHSHSLRNHQLPTSESVEYSWMRNEGIDRVSITPFIWGETTTAAFPASFYSPSSWFINILQPLISFHLISGKPPHLSRQPPSVATEFRSRLATVILMRSQPAHTHTHTHKHTHLQHLPTQQLTCRLPATHTLTTLTTHTPAVSTRLHSSHQHWSSSFKV